MDDSPEPIHIKLICLQGRTWRGRMMSPQKEHQGFQDILSPCSVRKKKNKKGALPRKIKKGGGGQRQNYGCQEEGSEGSLALIGYQHLKKAPEAHTRLQQVRKRSHFLQRRVDKSQGFRKRLYKAEPKPPGYQWLEVWRFQNRSCRMRNGSKF